MSSIGPRNSSDLKINKAIRKRAADDQLAISARKNPKAPPSIAREARVDPIRSSLADRRRNSPCYCSSGKKLKKCCGPLIDEVSALQHDHALKGEDVEAAIQLRRLFTLKDAYRGDPERCTTCWARDVYHPAVYYYRTERLTCKEFTA